MSSVPNLDRFVAAYNVAHQKIVDMDDSDAPVWEKDRRARELLNPLLDEAGAAVRYTVNWMCADDPTPVRPRRRWLSRR